MLHKLSYCNIIFDLAILVCSFQNLRPLATQELSDGYIIWLLVHKLSNSSIHILGNSILFLKLRLHEHLVKVFCDCNVILCLLEKLGHRRVIGCVHELCNGNVIGCLVQKVCDSSIICRS